jgi:hypothetical protein
MLTTGIPPAMMSPTIGSFSVGDKIKVYGPSKHCGRTATIQKVGRKRLTVHFHDKLGGRYVTHCSAHIIDVPMPLPSPISTDDTTDDTTTLTEEQTHHDLTSVLEQLAITTATAIKTYEPGERDIILHAFVKSLDQYLKGPNTTAVTASSKH